MRLLRKIQLPRIENQLRWSESRTGSIRAEVERTEPAEGQQIARWGGPSDSLNQPGERPAGGVVSSGGPGRPCRRCLDCEGGQQRSDPGGRWQAARACLDPGGEGELDAL